MHANRGADENDGESPPTATCAALEVIVEDRVWPQAHPPALAIQALSPDSSPDLHRGTPQQVDLVRCRPACPGPNPGARIPSCIGGPRTEPWRPCRGPPVISLAMGGAVIFMPPWSITNEIYTGARKTFSLHRPWLDKPGFMSSSPSMMPARVPSASSGRASATNRAIWYGWSGHLHGGDGSCSARGGGGGMDQPG
jgi:hypothetical protein